MRERSGESGCALWSESEAIAGAHGSGEAAGQCQTSAVDGGGAVCIRTMEHERACADFGDGEVAADSRMQNEVTRAAEAAVRTEDDGGEIRGRGGAGAAAEGHARGAGVAAAGIRDLDANDGEIGRVAGAGGIGSCGRHSAAGEGKGRS